MAAMLYGFHKKLAREMIYHLWNTKNDWHRMNKRLLSQLLDGAAFPAIMLAIAVGPMTVAPDHGNTSGLNKRGATTLNGATGVQQQAKGMQEQWVF
jgi:hypothetical protein